MSVYATEKFDCEAEPSSVGIDNSNSYLVGLEIANTIQGWCGWVAIKYSVLE